jgi:7-carboxy-7-deazaguanine synthase
MMSAPRMKKVSELKVTEVFFSMQGESSFVGWPTVFVRLSGCNMRCEWCDTTYAFEGGETYSFDDLFNMIAQYDCRRICVTGGEPLIQEDVHPFMAALCDKGYIVSLETSGCAPTKNVDPRVYVILDIKCPGSKMAAYNIWENIDNLRAHDEVKFVIKDRADYEWAKGVCAKYDISGKTAMVLFSPVYGALAAHDLVAWTLEDNIDVRINIQLHKYVWPHKNRGV